MIGPFQCPGWLRGVVRTEIFSVEVAVDFVSSLMGFLVAMVVMNLVTCASAVRCEGCDVVTLNLLAWGRKDESWVCIKKRVISQQV